MCGLTVCSWCLANDEDAHEENHDEKDPHKESVHDFSNFFPFCPLDTCSPLLSEAVCNVFNIAHQLGVHTRDATAMATEHTGAKRNSGALGWGLFVFRAVGRLLIFSATWDFLVFFTAVTCRNFAIRAFVLPRCKAGEVASFLPGDVVLGFHSGVMLRLWGLGPGVFVALSLIPATSVPWFTICLKVRVEVLLTDVIIGGVKRQGRGRRGSSAVLTYLIHKENLRHIVNDKDFGPVWNWFGLCTTEVDVHDEDGESCGSCYHGHGGNIVFPCVTEKTGCFVSFSTFVFCLDLSISEPE